MFKPFRKKCNPSEEKEERKEVPPPKKLTPNGAGGVPQMFCYPKSSFFAT
jgi:hypothetical protein